ncbi:F-box/LRR-repeat protein 2-like [Trifolium pratense]|uniref:F-box/LRR-repeat protein 2-like n=1 Tax=Trifolium pratense TaxID=57577 RepID=UPI001E69505F|nr:F-box/LRR-repeat protein 2-like [Trifolium pratense]
MTTVEERFLPEECWECILKRFLNECDDYNRYLQPLSILSKQFLSVTDRFRLYLIISNETIPLLPRLLQRCTNLTSLNLTRFQGDLDRLLCQISCFPLNFTSLNLSNQHTIPAHGLREFSKKITTLTSLTCSNIVSLHNNDLVLISDCFPFLEELDLSNHKNIHGKVNFMFLVLPKLRKVNLSGCYSINDRMLLHLCKNCEFLQEIVIPNNLFVNPNGIAFAIRQRPGLRSLTFSGTPGRVILVTNFPQHFIDSLVSLKGLTCLELSCLHIPDDLLYSIAMEGLPLKRLVLGHCTGFTSDGIHHLLSKCQCIQHLDLQKATFQDSFVYHKLSLCLGNLVSINLSHCYHLTEITLFTLVGRCPLLNEIYMENTCIGQMVLQLHKYSSLLNFVINPQMKSLHLASNTLLYDNINNIFASMCPNLELVDLSNCVCISKGIVQVLRHCKIMHLNLSSCPKVNLLGMNFEVPKLEVLNLSMTNIDDKTLYVISKNCSGLLQLDLEKCYNITEKGVKQVVKKCTRLKEINLRHCCKVSTDVALWMEMVLSSLSLRKIKTPPHFCPSHRKWKPLLNHGHGCILC